MSYSTRPTGGLTPLLHLFGDCEKCNKYVLYRDSLHPSVGWRHLIWQEVFWLPGDELKVMIIIEKPNHISSLPAKLNSSLMKSTILTGKS